MVLSTPEQFDAFFRGEMDTCAKVIKTAGFRIE